MAVMTALIAELTFNLFTHDDTNKYRGYERQIERKSMFTLPWPFSGLFCSRLLGGIFCPIQGVAQC